VYAIQAINGKLIIQNDSSISDQPYFVNSFASSIIIENSTIKQITSDGVILETVDSELNITNTQVNSLTDYGNGLFLEASFETKLNINGLIYTNSTMSMLRVLASSSLLDNVIISQLDIDENLISYIN